MTRIGKLRSGLVALACVGLVSMPVMAGHKVKTTEPCDYRDITAGGNLSSVHTGTIRVKTNTKDGSGSFKGEERDLRNSSGEKVKLKNLPGGPFGLPGFVLVKKYQVEANNGGGPDNHNDDGKIKGKF